MKIGNQQLQIDNMPVKYEVLKSRPQVFHSQLQKVQISNRTIAELRQNSEIQSAQFISTLSLTHSHGMLMFVKSECLN